MEHPSEGVQAALVRLNDELCSWERSTGRQSVLILREEGGFEHRSASGKPTIPDDVDDLTLWHMVGLRPALLSRTNAQPVKEGK